MPNNENTSDPQSVISHVAQSFIMQLIKEQYEIMMGIKYSAADASCLERLKKIYTQMCKNTPPIEWNFKDNRPTKSRDNQLWTEHVRQRNREKIDPGHYYAYSSAIAEDAATYLAGRNRRWIGKGRHSDPLELFMGEWVVYALDTLPTLPYCDESIKKIDQRLLYIDEVQNNRLFKSGMYRRQRNKFETMERIRENLLSARILCSKEALRQCAREQLDSCRINTGALLQAFAKIMYYARSLGVHNEPLSVENYISTKSPIELYTKVKQTHTGALLTEFISMCGLSSFNAATSNENELKNSIYFNESASPNAAFPLQKNYVHDLPPWIEEEIPAYYSAWQQVAKSALRISELKVMIEQAYDLTGKVGNLWAYGDKQGKLALNALIFLIGMELNTFSQGIKKIYKEQNDLRRNYNFKNHNPHKDFNDNYNQLDAQMEELNKFCKTIRSSIKAIKKQMSKFNAEETIRIRDQKKSFYKNILQFLEKYYGDLSENYKLLRDPLCETENISNLDSDLKFILVDEGNIDPARTSQFKNPQLNQGYQRWLKNYFYDNKNDYFQLYNKISQFKKMLSDNTAPNITFIDQVNEIEVCLQNLKSKLQAQSPAFKFKDRMWIIRFFGMMFYRKENQYYTALSENYDIFTKEIKEMVGVEGNIPKDQKCSLFIKKHSQVQYKDNKSIFLPAQNAEAAVGTVNNPSILSITMKKK